MPNIAARAEPTASMTAPMSSIRSSIDGGLATGSDMPVPRLSNTISRENDASRVEKPGKAGSSHATSTWETKPGTRTRSIAPSPMT